MYDTIQPRLAYPEVTSKVAKQTVDRLSNVTYTEFPDGTPCYTGYFRKVKVRVTENSISIPNVSLPKVLYNENISNVNFRTTSDAIEVLEDGLQLNLSNASLTRLDLAQNFIMKHPVEAYFHDLGELRYFVRRPDKDGLYYDRGKNMQLIFYDKNKEAKTKQMTVPYYTKNENLLRYELRFKKRLTKALNMPSVKVSHLTQEEFYMKVVDRWEEEFNNITKKSVFKSFCLSNKATGLERQLAFLGLTYGSTEADIRGAIKKAQIMNHISNQDAKRLRDRLSLILSQGSHLEPSELMDELSQKVSLSCRYFR